MELLPLLQGMSNLMDRVSFRCTLRPFDVAETRRVIQFRLQEAGYRSRLPLFTDEAIEAVYEYSEGYPRRIAMICHRILRTLVMRNGREVDAAMVEELIQEELDGGWCESKRLQKSNSSV